MSRINCIIVGYNDVDFGDYAFLQEQFAKHGGSYHEVKTNSVLVNGNRETYMDLLNRVLAKKTRNPWSLNGFKMPNLGVAYLASFLKKRGFSVELINFFNSGKLELKERLEEGVDSVAITTTYYVDDEPIKQIVKFVRAIDPGVKIIVGGPRIFSICNSMPEHMQDLTFRGIGADVYINSSEGEQTLAQVIAGVRDGSTNNLNEVPNLIYTDDGVHFRRTPKVIEKNDLDSNAVQWNLFDRDFYTPVTYMRTARSCPFACEFCNYPAYAGPHTLASIEVIEQEMWNLQAAGLKYLIFIDDTFNVPLPRFKKLLQMMIRNKFEFQWISFFRCSNADDEAFDLMAESGCLGVYLGIESGDENVLKGMRKFADVKRYRESIGKLKQRNILTLASLIVGFPGETESSVQNTIDFLNQTQTTFYNVQLYFHDVLAPIEQRREQYGISGSAYSWSHNTMDWKQAIELKEHMLKSIKGPILMPLYGFSIWTIPYLLQHGFSVSQVLEFSQFANGLLFDELGGATEQISDRIDSFTHAMQIENLTPAADVLCGVRI